MNKLILPTEADTRLAREGSPDRRDRDVREKEFITECNSIIKRVADDFNISYACEFREDEHGRFLEIRFASGEQRATNRTPYRVLVEAEKPFLIISQEVSALISNLTYHKMKG